jgi:hypothetical protein
MPETPSTVRVSKWIWLPEGSVMSFGIHVPVPAGVRISRRTGFEHGNVPCAYVHRGVVTSAVE